MANDTVIGQLEEMVADLNFATVKLDYDPATEKYMVYWLDRHFKLHGYASTYCRGDAMMKQEEHIKFIRQSMAHLTEAIHTIKVISSLDNSKSE